MAKRKIDWHMLLQNCLRGGSWLYSLRRCRSAYRDWSNPVFRSYYDGFRVVRVPKPSVKKEQEKARKEG